MIDLQGGEVEAGQRTVLGGDLDLEALAGGEPDFPGDVAGGVVQVFFVAVRRVRELYQHALRQAAVQVEPHGVAPGCPRQHAAAQGLQVHAHQAGQGVDFFSEVVFDPGGAGQKQM